MHAPISQVVFLTQMLGQNPARPLHPELISRVYAAIADSALPKL
eukprot:COSAG05_NODE_74_length_21769_cov_194.316290_29_plen_44_part_00